MFIGFYNGYFVIVYQNYKCTYPFLEKSKSIAVDLIATFVYIQSECYYRIVYNSKSLETMWKKKKPQHCDSLCVLSCFSRGWLCGPMDCSLPDSSVHGIFQARILKWVAISFSRGSSQFSFSVFSLITSFRSVTPQQRLFKPTKQLNDSKPRSVVPFNLLSFN